MGNLKTSKSDKIVKENQLEINQKCIYQLPHISWQFYCLTSCNIKLTFDIPSQDYHQVLCNKNNVLSM